MLGSITRFLARRSYSQLSLPSSLSNAASVALPRSLIAVHGPDSNKFLNGLMTVRPPEITGREKQNGVAAFGALLNAKGRVITDLFVYPAHDNKEIQRAASTNGENCYVLEVDSAMSEKVLDLLDFHILMMDVKLTSLSAKFTTFAVWNDEAELNTAQLESHLWCHDSRAPGFGVRVVLPNGTVPVEAPGAPLREYQLRRYLFGIPEGSDEIIPFKSLPLDSCFDYMGGIDFHKGCYQGQELTIRTHHHGNVRKRVMPVVFTRHPDEQLPEELYKPVDFGIAAGSAVVDESPVPNADQLEPIFASSPFKSSASRKQRRPAGKVIGSIGNVGLAKMRVDVLGHNFLLENSEVYVRPMVPYWWPAQNQH